MARQPYADLDDPSIRPAAERVRAARAGKVPHLFQMLLHNPAIAEGWLGFMTAVRKASKLDGRTREIVILRAARLLRAEYPVNDHIPIALKDGLSQAEIDALLAGDLGGFGGRERAVIDFVDASTLQVQVPDGVFAALGAHFSAQEITELAVLTGAYNMVARFLEAMRIDLEEG